jgi:hypothetical protein
MFFLKQIFNYSAHNKTASKVFGQGERLQSKWGPQTCWFSPDNTGFKAGSWTLAHYPLVSDDISNISDFNHRYLHYSSSLQKELCAHDQLMRISRSYTMTTTSPHDRSYPWEDKWSHAVNTGLIMIVYSLFRMSTQSALVLWPQWDHCASIWWQMSGMRTGKDCSSATLTTTNFTRTIRDRTWASAVRRLPTNHLRYGTAKAGTSVSIYLINIHHAQFSIHQHAIAIHARKFCDISK